MTAGPGKYDPECSEVRVRTGALTVILLVLGGDRGTSFSVQTVDPTIARRLSGILREVAEQIDADNEFGPVPS